jgi:CRP-like cAMP-binding protein
MAMEQVPARQSLNSRAISDSVLAGVLAELGTTVLISRGTVLFEQGHQASGILVLRKGKVRLSHLCEDGQRWTHVVGPGHILGLLATVSDQPYRKTAEAMEDCELVPIDRNRVMTLLRQRADFWLQAIRVVAEELKLIKKQVFKPEARQAS